MHWYKHHLGDYETRTRHLSLGEHGAYRLLMDAYYATEQPLPLDIDIICKIIRVSKRAEKRHVLSVIRAFFEQDLDGYRHKRIDSEIAVYREKALINKGNAKRLAKRNGGESHSESLSQPVTNNHKPVTNIDIPPIVPQGGHDQTVIEISEFEMDPEGGEPESLPLEKAVNVIPEGGERHAEKAVNDVHTNSPINSSRKSRGCRIPDDWLPDREYARNHGMSEPQIDMEAENFVNYWCAVPGARGVKLDWSATWRNRVLFLTKDKFNGKIFGRGGAAPTKTDRVNAVLDGALRDIAAGVTGFEWAKPDGGNSHAMLSGPEPVRQGAGATGGGDPPVPDGPRGLFD